MFSDEILRQDGRDIELEIERKCIILGLDVTNKIQLQQFAENLLQNIDELRKAAVGGDRLATMKVELYGLAMLMHKTNSELLGAGYLTQFEDLSRHQTAWAAVAAALWRELEVRNQ